MLFIFVGFVLLFVIAVFAPYVIAIAVVFILNDRWIAAFFVSLVPLLLLVASIFSLYFGFQDIRREFRKPRRRLSSDDVEGE
jgi:uncharacterized membrane protein YqjE